MKRILLFISFMVLVLCFVAVCTRQDDSSALKGPYLGQKLPEDEPELFMPGLVSTHDFDGCIAFLDDAKVCLFQSTIRGVYYTYEKDGVWTIPQKAPFQNQRGATDCTVLPDGRTLIFQSSRLTSPEDTKRDANAWVVEWTGSGWTKAHLLPSPPNSEKGEGYPSMSSDGTMFFFSSSRDRSRCGEMFYSPVIDGKYLPAERLEEPLNTEYHEIDPIIAPDRSYIIFGSGRPGGYKFGDVYICFRKENGSWTHPFNIGERLNAVASPARMSVTSDGKYFFFISDKKTDIPKGEMIESPVVERYGEGDVYWVSTRFISNLKNKFLNKICAAQVFEKEYRENSLEAAVEKLRELYQDKQDTHYFELSEFLILCGRMIKSGYVNEADQIYKALLNTLPEEFRIKQGYALAHIMNDSVQRGLKLMSELWARYPSAKLQQWIGILTYQLSSKSKSEDVLRVLLFSIEEFPESYQAYHDLAETYDSIGDTENAKKYCKRSLELNPDYTYAKDLLKELEKK